MRTALVAIMLGAALFGGAAWAEPLPEAGRAFLGNLKTLMHDSKAPRTIATCAAYAHEFAKTSKWDRIGFTRANLAAARTSRAMAPFSASDPRTVAAVTVIPATARLRAASAQGQEWQEINVRCGERDGAYIAIELLQAAP